MASINTHKHFPLNISPAASDDRSMHEVILQTVVKKLKNDPVLYISGALAVASMFIVHPDANYISYLNLRVLAILFALMLIVSALTRIGTFEFLTGKILSRISSEKRMSLFLVILSFFMSMFLTNDVTLVTLVPFSIMVLKAFGDNRRLMYSLILMTVSANLGSMLTPIGNPQNLYLYTNYHIEMGDFLLLMLPFSTLSMILLIIAVLIFNRTDKTVDTCINSEVQTPNIRKLAVYLTLFVISILTVTGQIHYGIMLLIVGITTLIMDKGAFRKVDYSLLLTFCFFFVLIGNLQRIDVIYNTLSGIVEKNVTLTAILSSQIISNVPAAMLLSAFTDNGRALIIGSNLGGLGTIIASMTSLITFKFYNNEVRSGQLKEGGNYLLSFSVINVLILVALYAAYLVIK